MTSFLLLHGGAHDGWCWRHVMEVLEHSGHRAVAPDLPIEDPACGALDWGYSGVEAASDLDDLVVVGHSMGGMAVPVVAALRPVRLMIFLSAMVPMPGMIFNEYLATQPLAITAPHDRMRLDSLGRSVVPADVAREYFYEDCEPAMADEACSRLRPTAMTAFTEVSPLVEWPATPSVYVIGIDDRAVSPAWGQQVATQWLNAPFVALPGGHSPFLARPALLANALLDVADGRRRS